MDRETILSHIDREIAFREELCQKREGGIIVEIEYIDKSLFNSSKAEFLWGSISDIHEQTEDLRLEWLKKLHSKVEAKIEENGE
jgi:hypothetical protein